MTAPLTLTVIVLPSQTHSTRVQSPRGLSTSCLPRVSSNSLKSRSCRDHQSCPPVKMRLLPPFFQRGRLSCPRTASVVSETDIPLPLSSLPRMTIRSPTRPCASWHSIHDSQVPPAPPSGPTAFSRMPELRTYLPQSVFLPQRYSTIR